MSEDRDPLPPEMVAVLRAHGLPETRAAVVELLQAGLEMEEVRGRHYGEGNVLAHPSDPALEQAAKRYRAVVERLKTGGRP